MADVAIDTQPAGANTGASSASTQRITSTSGMTGDMSDIVNAFISFGYYPTQAEAASFLQAEGAHGGGAGEKGSAQALTAAFIGQYVQNMDAEQSRVASDPLTAYAAQANDLAQQQQTQSNNLYSQAQSVFQSAPKLFGSLTPDQISEYLAPLQTAFTTAQQQTEAQEAARGLTGSNIEANALQTGNTNFNNEVLQTGLAVGQTAQTNVGNSLQTQAAGLLSASTTNKSLQGQAAGQISSQNLAQQNYLQSLPFLFGQASVQDEATRQALAQASKASSGGGGIGSLIGTVGGAAIGSVVPGIGTGVGAAIGGSLGGGIGNLVSPGTTGYQPGYGAGLPSSLQLLTQQNALKPPVPSVNSTGGLATSNNDLTGTEKS